MISDRRILAHLIAPIILETFPLNKVIMNNTKAFVAITVSLTI